jgi:ankyrin repeat protein
MPLPTVEEEAVLGALDEKCSSPHSASSKRLVQQLLSSTLEEKEHTLLTAALLDLPNLVRCALEAHTSPDTKLEYGAIPALAVAACDGSPNALKALIAGGASLDVPDQRGHTALMHATRKRNVDCVQILLAAGANANVRDTLGCTALADAVGSLNVVCARALLPHSNPLLMSRHGFNVFHISVMAASTECFEMLLPLMSDVDVRSVPGIDPLGQPTTYHHQTALHIACAKGLQQICKALLKRGASRTAVFSVPHTPLHLAAGHGHLSCVLLLVGRPGKVRMTPAEVNAADESGDTALHNAAFHGYEKVCGVLIAAGARLDATTLEGFTPLMIARRFQPTNTALHALLSGNGPAQLPGTFCDHCGKTAEQASVPFLKTCGACHGMRYCSTTCSAAAWPGHKAACKARAAEREKLTEVGFVEPPV